MLSITSFILVLVGCANWLTIGLLQFDFVAGLFGSQSNIFSRIVYVLIGVAAVIMVVNLIKNKGKLFFKIKKKAPKTEVSAMPAKAESAQDNAKAENTQLHTNIESAQDNAKTESSQSEAGSDYTPTQTHEQHFHTEAGSDYQKNQHESHKQHEIHEAEH